MKGHKANEDLVIELDIQYPHDVLAFYSRYPEKFQQIFGSPEEVEGFWLQKDTTDPAFVHHPALQREDYTRLCVPLRLHSDAAVMSKTESLHVVSWSTYFGQGAVLEWQLLFGAVVKSACLSKPGSDTMGELYKALSWSLEACLAGVHPAKDRHGADFPAGSKRSRLAGQRLHPQGYFFAVFQVLGDLDELCNAFGLRHFNSLTPCFWCFCNTEDVLWSEFGPTARWRRMLEESVPDKPKPSDHPLWTVPGLSVHSIGWDVLHGMDLGPSLHVAANILEDLLQNAALGRGAEERLATLWDRIVVLYREMGIHNRLHRLELTAFRRPGEYPRLRAKGNECRHLIPVLQRLLQEYGQDGSEYSKIRDGMVGALVRFYEILDSKELFLSGVLVAEGQLTLRNFLQGYTWLAYRAIQRGQLRWQVTIKFHYVAHAVALLRWSNLRFSSTYPGESFVGKVSRIAFTASLGKPAYALGGLLMQKIQAGRAIRLRRDLA